MAIQYHCLWLRYAKQIALAKLASEKFKFAVRIFIFDSFGDDFHFQGIRQLFHRPTPQNPVGDYNFLHDIENDTLLPDRTQKNPY